MGKTMPKSTVIYGQQHAIAVKSFSSANVNAIISLLEDKVGPEVVKPLKGTITQAINRAVTDAKNHKKMKDAYVKVGVIDGDLILRCKEKKFFGDIEIDATLIKGYKPKAKKYEVVKIQKQMEEIEKAAELEQQRKKNRELLLTPQRGELLRKKSEPKLNVSSNKVQTNKEESESNERQSEQDVTPVLSKKEQEEKERQERLRKVMNTPDEHGETMRDKLMRAAQKGQKLGVGKGTQERLKAQGLTAMDERYHGEVLDHQKNRYGRHLKPLKDVWDKVETRMNFSQWLDEVEKRNTSVPGVSQALTLKNPDDPSGKRLIVEEGGTTGGTMVYLDDEGRKPYEARASKGSLTGTHVSNGEVIFVIGPDNKLYAGKKARAQAGKRGAFNHSSFFSGAPIKSAGTVIVSGGKVTTLSDLSGHYTPTPAMVITAIRKIGGGDQDWLNSVRIMIGNKDVGTGAEFLAGESQKRQTETWKKYSHGQLTSNWAAGVLTNGEDGSWLVRENRDNLTTVSYIKAGKVDHQLIGELGRLGLERAKLIVPGKLPPEKPKTETQPKPKEQPKGLSPNNAQTIRRSPAFHGVMNSEGAGKILADKPVNSWLVRENREGILAYSYVQAPNKVMNSLINTDEIFATVNSRMSTYAGLMVTP